MWIRPLRAFMNRSRAKPWSRGAEAVQAVALGMPSGSVLFFVG